VSRERLHGTRVQGPDNVVTPVQEKMYERAGAHVSRVRTAYLSLITR
jgi:hypothetical protein